mmetsp:Transcript_12224/g.23098  ORF Transcript_12224/g.23098 Transcript_12224/m.23098 type:complete len:609 (+) Transcript_12224:70-1896(+)
MAPSRWRQPAILPLAILLVLGLFVRGLVDVCFTASNDFASSLQASRKELGTREGRRLRAVGLGFDSASMVIGDSGEISGLPVGGIAAFAALLIGAAVVLASRTQQRPDGAKEEDLPPWANMVQVMQDVLSGQPFDAVLLNMRARHGDAFRIYVPSLFGEVFVLMGLEANQFVFTEQDKNLDQALGGVVGTAVSGKKTMGTKERKSTESGKIFDKASAAFFANKQALGRATQIFLDSAEDFCDQMERELKSDENVFERLWTYVVQTNADMLYGNGENAGRIVCKTIDSINKEGLFSPQVRQAGDDLRTVLNERYEDRKQNPEKYLGEDSLFEEFFLLSKGEADDEMLQGLQQFMLTLQLAANGNQLVTIRWLMSHVYGDPAILAGIRAEVDALLLQKGCGIRDLQLDDLLKLSLTNACITEAVRLHSDIPSKLTLRSAEIPMEFGGFKIPQGATIFLYADAVHKDDKYFPDAASFCPHRYTDPEVFNQMNKDREIVAFGHGRKRCTGELHARSQISALLASFVMRFDMELVTSETDNRMPEDHDGPFVFDTANTLKLVNLRARAGEPGQTSAVASVAAAALPGRTMTSGSDNVSTGSCPFSGVFGSRRS